jgi:hypothetical protein
MSEEQDGFLEQKKADFLREYPITQKIEDVAAIPLDANPATFYRYSANQIKNWFARRREAGLNNEL